MIRKTGSFLLAAGILFSGSALAINMNDLIGRQYSFLPNLPVELKNPIAITLNISCIMSTKGPSNSLQVYGLNKTVVVNGQTLTQGSTITVSIGNGMPMNLRAEGYAAVRITNTGVTEITADCNLG